MPEKVRGARPPYANGYYFGEKSRRLLSDVHPHLVQVAELALSLSTVDFGVHCGSRTHQQQVIMKNSGASRTLKSRHVINPRTNGGNGFSHAIDVHPYIEHLGGDIWDWPLYYPIADSFRKAALKLKIPIRWGGIWNKYQDGSWISQDLRKITGDLESVRNQYISDYQKTHTSVDPVTGEVEVRQPLSDGPHFELPEKEYPDTKSVPVIGNDEKSIEQ